MSPYTHLPRMHRVAHEHPFALALIIFLIVVIPGFVRTQQLVSELHHNQKVSCHNGNDTRSDQIKLWEFVISLSPNTNSTPAEKARTKIFEAKLHEIFAPRHCP